MRHLEFYIRAAYSFVVFASICTAFLIVLLLQSKNHIFEYASEQASVERHEPFPISVDPESKTIEENPLVKNYFSEHLAHNQNSKQNWWNQIAAIFAPKDWYQNLASPVSRIIVIWPGERKEEAAKNISDILGWNNTEKTEFKSLVDTEFPIMPDGKYFPSQYIIHKYATPSEVAELVNSKFNDEVLSRYPPELDEIIPLEDTLTIASLLEREASDFDNMREISGVIWNRLFIDMPLQLDASLQYVKGSNAYEPAWWPQIYPRDKFIKSPFNTYQNEGLPPAPIANPSVEAIVAALNPVVTDCLFYFHTNNGEYHCSTNYKEHVSKLRSIYGRGS